MNNDIKTIPYGISDFGTLRRLNGYYVDNTWGIPLLEALPYQMFLRPRRFGKSLLLSILRHYYDVLCADRFDELFGGTWIHEHPTPFRGQYMVLYLDFSKVEGQTLADFQVCFDKRAKTALDGFVERYNRHLPSDIAELVHKQSCFSDGFDILVSRMPEDGMRIFIMIDEYDNFSNRLLAQAGEATYHELCHGTGFFKSFFALLKAENRVVERIFLTGVSPMTLDDVTSGFNIAENISQRPNLATLCGFTHDDIRKAMDYYADAGRLSVDREQAFSLVTDWYDHYRFSIKNDDQICNPILLFGFLDRCMADDDFPQDMVDENLRTDYGKLRHLVVTNGRLNGKFNALESFLTDGGVTTKLVRSFQAEALARPDNFISLLFYYGMVTIAGKDFDGVKFVIPNQLMRRFISDFLLNGYQDVCGVSPNSRAIASHLGKLARDGDWRPAIEAASQVVKETLSVRDLMDGEKAVQASLASLLSAGSAFAVRTVHRAGFGFADLALAPRLINYPDIRYCALIEVKYIKKTEAVTDAGRAELLSEARTQLERYASDNNLAEAWHLTPTGTVTLIRLAVVFHGEELLLAEEI